MCLTRLKMGNAMSNSENSSNVEQDDKKAEKKADGKNLRVAERAVDRAFSTGKADRAFITRPGVHALPRFAACPTASGSIVLIGGAHYLTVHRFASLKKSIACRTMLV